MKKVILTIFIITVLVFGWTLAAQALLIDNLDGTVTQVRSDGSSLMWLQDAGKGGVMPWGLVQSWASSLDFAGYSDWRVPDGDNSCVNNTSCLGSEMGYLFYDEGGTFGSPLPNILPFVNLHPAYYWTDTLYAARPNPAYAWFFNFEDGAQVTTIATSSFYAWAVRDTANPVPEPGTLFLLSIGIIGMLTYKKRAKIRSFF